MRDARVLGRFELLAAELGAEGGHVPLVGDGLHVLDSLRDIAIVPCIEHLGCA